MQCTRCDKILPTESEYCPYCGISTKEIDKEDIDKEVISNIEMEIDRQPRKQKVKKIKQYRLNSAYCTNCGKIRYRKLGMCLECGKKYFTMTKTKVLAALFFIMLVVSLFLFFLLLREYEELSDQYSRGYGRISTLEEQMSRIKDVSSAFYDEYFSWAVENIDDVPIFVISTSAGGSPRVIKFHRYVTCEWINLTTPFEITTMENALNEKHIACDECYPELKKYYE